MPEAVVAVSRSGLGCIGLGSAAEKKDTKAMAGGTKRVVRRFAGVSRCSGLQLHRCCASWSAMTLVSKGPDAAERRGVRLELGCRVDAGDRADAVDIQARRPV